MFFTDVRCAATLEGARALDWVELNWYARARVRVEGFWGRERATCKCEPVGEQPGELDGGIVDS